MIFETINLLQYFFSHFLQASLHLKSSFLNLCKSHILITTSAAKKISAKKPGNGSQKVWKILLLHFYHLYLSNFLGSTKKKKKNVGKIKNCHQNLDDIFNQGQKIALFVSSVSARKLKCPSLAPS